MHRRSDIRLRQLCIGGIACMLLGIAQTAPCAPAAPLPADPVDVAAPAGTAPHPLEVRALLEPEQVLAELPAAIAAASDRGDHRELALLKLAEANACRVIARWICQRDAGEQATAAARRLPDPQLAARGLILASRATIAMQDYTRGERMLGEAETQLERAPSAELSADVMLAYSSLSHMLGKHALAAEYAQRGLAALGTTQAYSVHARLERNLARALGNLGRFEESRAALQRGMDVAAKMDDPKLSAELYLESARIARRLGDLDTQREQGAHVIALGARLRNSQLTGQGHEVLALAALDGGDSATAQRELLTAYESFRSLGQQRDELRAARQLIAVMLEQRERPPEFERLVRRFLELDQDVAQRDRAAAADDFDARLEYAQRELELARLEGEAMLSREREAALRQTQRLTLGLVVLGALMVAVLSAFYVIQRRSNRRLRATLAELRVSEARATDLLRLSRGCVFLHDADGVLTLVNPATADALGVAADALVGRSFAECIPAARRDDFAEYLTRVRRNGEDEGRFVVQRADGGERHWRYGSRLSIPAAGHAYVICNAVDVTDQAREAQALREQNQRDPLTGCYNRRWLDAFAQLHDATGARFAVINVDLDHFKQINDTRGHDYGDQVLVRVAWYLQERVRPQDAVVRTGGDEFVIVFDDIEPPALDAVLARLHGERDAAPCGLSIGSARREGGEPLVRTMARADETMYELRRQRRAAAAAS